MRPSTTHPGRFAMTAVALTLFTLTACDSNSDEASCEVFQTCDVQQALKVSLIESRSRLPANVSILFKVDTVDDAPVAGLLPANFDIFENEKLISQFESQRNILPKVGQFKYSIALLLDLSGSIVASENLDALKEAAMSFVDAVMFAPDDARYGEIEMAIWWFDGQADVTPLVGVTIDPEQLSAGIESITPELMKDNSTNLYGAVIQGIGLTEQRLDAIVRQNVISAGSVVLFTDGTDQANRESKSDALEAVRRSGDEVSVYTIGLGGEIDEETLTEIGRDGFVSAPRIEELLPKFQEIANLVRDEANSYYLLEYCSPKREGDNTLTIRVTAGPEVGLLTTRFSAENFTGGCAVSKGALPTD
ncbi:hypothetical protein [Rhodocaloribacter sp.]